MIVAHCPREFAVEDIDINEGVRRADEVAPFVLCRTKVTLRVEFVIQPGVFEGGGVLGQLFAGFTVGRQGLVNHFRSDHARFHCSVAAFNLGEIQCAGVTADQQAAWEGHFGQRLKTAFGDGPSAV